jgi:hypothetical protein
MRKPGLIILAVSLAIGLKLPVVLLGASDNALLTTLRDVRAASIAAMPAGHGEVILDRHEEMIASNDVLDAPSHPGEFRFAGKSSVLLEHDDTGNAILASTLWPGNQTVTKYYAGKPPIPRAVSVAAVGNPLASVDLAGYSFADFVRLPESGMTDSELFKGLAAAEGLVVHRDGQYVTIHELREIQPKAGAGGLSDEYTAKFDLLAGGMVVDYTHVHIKTADAKTTTEHWSWEWTQQQQGYVTPKSIKASVVVASDTPNANAKVSYRATSTVRFKEFQRDGADAKAPTMDELQIGRGTPVVDTIRGVQWKYFAGADAGGSQETTHPAREDK